MSSDTPQWSLEDELCKMGGAQDLLSALRNIGFEASKESPLLDVSDWVRSGAETFLLTFFVNLEERSSIRLALKACVAYSPGVTLESLFGEWLKRRALVARCGVSTPKLFATLPGVLLEEYIPHTFWEVLQSSQSRATLIAQLGYYSGTLSRLRFRPLDAFADLRSRGNDLVMIDFGEDLGPALLSSSGDFNLLRLTLEHLKKSGINLSADERILLSRSFDVSLTAQ